MPPIGERTADRTYGALTCAPVSASPGRWHRRWQQHQEEHGQQERPAHVGAEGSQTKVCRVTERVRVRVGRRISRGLRESFGEASSWVGAGLAAL